MRARKGAKAQKKPKLELLDQIKSDFVCSGSIELKKSFRLYYSSEENPPGFLTFPKIKEKDIEHAIKSAQLSGFAKGKQNVVDE